MTKEDIESGPILSAKALDHKHKTCSTHQERQVSRYRQDHLTHLEMLLVQLLVVILLTSKEISVRINSADILKSIKNQI
jgi:hypothetical protein